MSLDTVDPDRYRELTRGGSLARALEGIHAAVAEGFALKINMVILDDTTEEEIAGVAALCARIGARLQRVERYELFRRRGRSAVSIGLPPARDATASVSPRTAC